MRKQQVALAVLVVGTIGVLSSPASASPVVPWPTVLSLRPLFSDGAHTVFEPRLLGTWRGSFATFTFEQADADSYYFTVTTRVRGVSPYGVEKETRTLRTKYRAHLVKVGAHLFLDVLPTGLPQAGHWHGTRGGHYWRLHSFMLVQSIGPTLSVSPVNNKDLFRKASRVETVEQDGRLLLLCSTAKLREVLLDLAKHGRLYTGTFAYPKDMEPADKGRAR